MLKMVSKGNIFLLLTVIILSSCGGKSRKESLTDSVYEVVPKYKYGLCVDSFFVYHSIVKPDVNVSEILNKFGVPQEQVNDFVAKSNKLFDLRRMKAGNVFAVFLDLDNNNKVRNFVYEISPIEFLMGEFGDSIKVFIEHKNVKTIERIVNVKIESSLWKSVIDNKINPVLAVELSEIYSWSIDFFALKKGDSFKAIFTESFVDSLSVGITDIKACVFNNDGKDIYAFPYLKDGKLAYFDFDGKSLKKAFLKAPLRYSRISSCFSKRRLHPVLRIVRPHWGVDYVAPVGTPVQTIADGIVLKMGYMGGAGNLIRVKHSQNYESAYMHLSKFPKGVRVGSRIKQGDLVGYVGSTGLSTGAHLDFRIYLKGKPIDPLKLISPPSEPLKGADLQKFKPIADSLKRLLL